MKIHRFWPLLFGIIVTLAVNSCTKTVVQDNTVTKTVVDSVRDTVGVGLIRFVSMFPGGLQIPIYEADSSTLLTIAGNSCPNNYIPIPSDKFSTFYAFIPSLGGFKLLPVAALGHTMNTFALFLSVSGNDSIFNPFRNIDSEKFTSPLPGYCYIRLINGVADAAGPLFVDLDTVGHPISFPPKQTPSVPNNTMSNYTLIPSGQHTIFLRVDNPNDPNPQVPFSKNFHFADGGYYTVNATGSVVGGTIGIDLE